MREKQKVAEANGISKNKQPSKKKKVPKREPWRERPEYKNTEAQWRETGDIGFAALAIGRWYVGYSWPEGEVPEWALDACAALYQKALVGIQPVLKATQGGQPDKDDIALLDRVARAKNANSSLNTRTMFRTILNKEKGLEHDFLENAVKRLSRYWGRETKDASGGNVSNDHMSRVGKIDALAIGGGRSWGDYREDGTPSPKRRTPRRPPERSKTE